MFFLVFHVGFSPQVVFIRIYTFPVDSMLTEFAKQHITWCTEVIRKLLSSAFWRPTLPASRAAASTCLHCLGGGWKYLWSDVRLVPRMCLTIYSAFFVQLCDSVCDSEITEIMGPYISVCVCQRQPTPWSSNMQTAEEEEAAATPKQTQ